MKWSDPEHWETKKLPAKSRRRLEELVEKLKTVKREEFDMGTFWCGTAGCAIGHACHLPNWRRAGIRLVSPESPDMSCEVEFRGDFNFCAIAEFLGIDKWDADELFIEGEGHKTPKQVARNIESFLKAMAKKEAVAT